MSGSSPLAPSVCQAFAFLVAHPCSVPAGTFVFVLSDFLVPPPPDRAAGGIGELDQVVAAAQGWRRERLVVLLVLGLAALLGACSLGTWFLLKALFGS